MGDLVGIVVIVLIAFGVVALGWWLLIETEGVYLGRRVVIWLYDLYAGRYDDIKHFRKDYDHMFLAQPIMELITPIKSPLVLDVATGTGRLPLAMLRHAHFQGRVVGTDLSRKMLSQAAEKVADPRVSLLWCSAEKLPFPDDSFDVVTCLEALEFMERPAEVVRELARVLRPGGLLFVTNRLTARLMPGKAWKDADLLALLDTLGIENVSIDYWQVDYNRVWGFKQGQSAPMLARPLAEVLRCPKCSTALLIEDGAGWTCPNCGFHAPIAEDGVIEIGV
jgi:ubiquinone/menaquinone biosynthesis C-methylase UbiE